MSIRAHAIKKIEYYEDSPEFNLSHDELLMDLIGDNLYDTLVDGTGMAEISVEEIDSALECLKVKPGIKKVEALYTQDVLFNLRKKAEDGGGYLQLECY